MIGLLVQRKTINQMISGTIKAVVGFLLVLAGVEFLADSLLPLETMLRKIFGMQTITVHSVDQLVNASLLAYGTSATLIFAFGFLVNVLLARFTPFKYIHLSAHVSFFYAGLIAALLTVGTDLSTTHIIWIGSLMLGIYLTLSSAMVAPFMKYIPGDHSFTLGHSSSIICVVSGLLGKLVGNKEKDLEKIELPARLGFLRETIPALTLIMMLFFIMVTLFAGKDFVELQVSAHKDWLLYALLQGLKFGVGITILTTGVRMLLTEVIPAFHGIAEKVVPNSTPGFDLPLLFPQHPTSVIVGFFCSLVASVIGMIVLGIIQYPVVVFPALIPTFFTGAAAAIFGNATGGRRGAVMGATLNGFILIFGQAFLLPFVGNYETVMRVLSEPDYTFYGPIIGWLLHQF